MVYEKKDPKGYVDLFCWQGVPDDQKQRELKLGERIVEKRLMSVGFNALPWYLPRRLFTYLVEYTDKRDGVRYLPNLTIIGSLDVVSAEERNPGGKITVVYYLGEKEGRLYFVRTIPAHGNRNS